MASGALCSVILGSVVSVGHLCAQAVGVHSEPLSRLVSGVITGAFYCVKIGFRVVAGACYSVSMGSGVSRVLPFRYSSVRGRHMSILYEKFLALAGQGSIYWVAIDTGRLSGPC